MKSIIITLSLAAFQAVAYGGPLATPALVAHNATHKVEHLAEANKIDQHFVDRVYSVQVIALNPVNHTDPSFKATVMQVPDADGKAQSIEILLDDAAKALSYKEIAGPESRTAPAWPGVDALTLLEDGQHYVVDNATLPEVKPFANGMTSAVLTQALDADKRAIAKVVIQAKDTKSVLEVLLKTDGTLISAKVIKP